MSKAASPNQGQKDPTALRLKLLKNGFQPLPAKGKAVLLKKWNRGRITEDRIRSWQQKKRWTNTGLRCKNLMGIDIDVSHAGLTDAIIKFTREQLGDALERVGRQPRSLLLYGRGFPLKKQVLSFSYKGTEHKVEILADGQQFVGFGVHPGTGVPGSPA